MRAMSKLLSVCSVVLLSLPKLCLSSLFATQALELDAELEADILVGGGLHAHVVASRQGWPILFCVPS